MHPALACFINFKFSISMKIFFLKLSFWISLFVSILFGVWAINFRIIHQETNPILISIAVFTLILSGIIFDKRRKNKKRINRKIEEK